MDEGSERFLVRNEGMVVLILTIVLVIVLIYSEYVAHDCIPHKVCNHSVPAPTDEDSNSEFIDKVIDMVQNNTDYVLWRQALLVGLISSIPVIYYLRRRLPTYIEWVAVTLLVFLAAYLSSSWIWSHFFNPNANAIEKSLLQLRDRLS